MANQLDKIERLIEEMRKENAASHKETNEKLSLLAVETAKTTVSLEEHMRRTEVAEDSIAILQNLVLEADRKAERTDTRLDTFTRTLMVVGGTIVGIMTIVGIVWSFFN